MAGMFLADIDKVKQPGSENGSKSSKRLKHKDDEMGTFEGGDDDESSNMSSMEESHEVVSSHEFADDAVSNCSESHSVGNGINGSGRSHEAAMNGACAKNKRKSAHPMRIAANANANVNKEAGEVVAKRKVDASDELNSSKRAKYSEEAASTRSNSPTHVKDANDEPINFSINGEKRHRDCVNENELAKDNNDSYLEEDYGENDDDRQEHQHNHHDHINNSFNEDDENDEDVDNDNENDNEKANDEIAASFCSNKPETSQQANIISTSS